MNHIIIMAGGVGSRFWPMSTPERPKQFIDVLGTGHTLLQLTADRFEGICPVENIWVVTSVRYRELVKAQLPGIPDSNILLEPCMRNTAPCIAYAAWKIKKKDPQANLIVTAADHIVMDVPEFKRVIREGIDFDYRYVADPSGNRVWLYKSKTGRRRCGIRSKSNQGGGRI